MICAEVLNISAALLSKFEQMLQTLEAPAIRMSHQIAMLEDNLTSMLLANPSSTYISNASCRNPASTGSSVVVKRTLQTASPGLCLRPTTQLGGLVASEERIHRLEVLQRFLDIVVTWNP